jgi:hypothetical protein
MEEEEGLLSVEGDNKEQPSGEPRGTVQRQTWLRIYLVIVHLALVIAVWRAVNLSRLDPLHSEESVYCKLKCPYQTPTLTRKYSTGAKRHQIRDEQRPLNRPFAFE